MLAGELRQPSGDCEGAAGSDSEVSPLTRTAAAGRQRVVPRHATRTAGQGHAAQNLTPSFTRAPNAARGQRALKGVERNYELAVKIRQEIANGKRKAMPADVMVEDKSDSNMHGDPGEPPKDMKVEQFQIRIPMDPKDFKNSQEQTAGTGQARKRKG
jgi:hypothetical protein